MTVKYIREYWLASSHNDPQDTAAFQFLCAFAVDSVLLSVAGKVYWTAYSVTQCNAMFSYLLLTNFLLSLVLSPFLIAPDSNFLNSCSSLLHCLPCPRMEFSIAPCLQVRLVNQITGIVLVCLFSLFLTDSWILTCHTPLDSFQIVDLPNIPSPNMLAMLQNKLRIRYLKIQEKLIKVISTWVSFQKCLLY